MNTKLLTHSEEYIISRLKIEFATRAGNNPSYSLRAFAQSINIDQSHLSNLSKRVRFSRKMSDHLCSVLKIRDKDLDSGSKELYFSMSEDKLELLNDWSHFALLELIKTKSFNPDPSKIARRLRLTPIHVGFVIERLLRLGLIDKNFKLKKASLEWNDLEKTTVARKLLQKSFLEKASEAIDRVAFEDRENSSLTVAISREKIPDLKKEILRFKNRLDDLCAEHNSKDEVYQLCIALYPLSELGEINA
jgi:DNA-binding MarR family transcriptional regulator